MFCPYCGKEINEGVDFCAKCNANLKSLRDLSEYECDKCGAFTPADAKFCSNCGDKFEEKQTTSRENSIFEVQRIGFLRKQKWTIRLTPDSVEFCGNSFSLKRIEFVGVSKHQGNTCIKFASAFFSGFNVTAKQDGKTYNFKLTKDDLSKLRSWMPKKSATDMKKELRKWGISLIVLGIIHFVLSEFLDPFWGIFIIIIGILNLLIRHRSMFIVNGIALLLVGVLNIFAGEGEIGGWSIFGCLQLVWGVQEIRKYNQYASANSKSERKQIEKRMKVNYKRILKKLEKNNTGK